MYGQNPVEISTKKAGKTNFKGRKVTGFTAHVEGMEDLINKFMDLGQDAIYKLAEPSTRAAEVVARRARLIAPIDTRNLRGWGITVRKPGKQKKSSHAAYKIFATVGIKKSAIYGVKVELGHKTTSGSQVEAQPFLRPAADGSREEVAEILVKAMNEILEEAGKK